MNPTENILSKGVTDEYVEFLLEFEVDESDDAKFSKGIDRVPPLLYNLH